MDTTELAVFLTAHAGVGGPVTPATLAVAALWLQLAA